MSAYIRQDRIDHEYQESAWRDDLMIERMSGEVLDDPIMIASAIADMDEEAPSVVRFAEALYNVYHSAEMTQEIMLLKSALYGVIKRHCQAVMEHF